MPRLIDADELKHPIGNIPMRGDEATFYQIMSDVARVIDAAPTIVRTREEAQLLLKVAALEHNNVTLAAHNHNLRRCLDAAIADLEMAADCRTCFHADMADPHLCDCEDGDQYTWRDVPEVPNEDD